MRWVLIDWKLIHAEWYQVFAKDRIQRQQKIIEPNKESCSEEGNSNEENNLAVSDKKEIKHYAKMLRELEKIDYDFTNKLNLIDDDMLELLQGAVRIPKSMMSFSKKTEMIDDSEM